MIDLFIEMKNTPKERARVTRSRTYTPSKTVVAQYVIGFEIKEYMIKNDRKMSKSSLEMSLIFFYKKPTSKKPVHISRHDVDNLAKTVMDALQGICYFNDNQIVNLSVVKRYCYDEDEHVYTREGVLIWIEEIKNEVV